MSSEEETKGVSLSPAAMVDSVADWSLHQVVDYLRKKEKEGKDAVQPSRMFCRSTVKSLVDVVDEVAAGYGVSRTRMSRWLSYHGIAIAREDAVIGKLAGVQSSVRSICLLEDDTDTMDVMNSLVPYAPRVVDENAVHLHLYDVWVGSEFEDIARVCGVYRYRAVQIFLIKSILSEGTEKLGETASRLSSELKRWDTWMGFRLAAFENLVEQKAK